MNHYTYIIEGLNKKYIGVRSCKCSPTEDTDYFGSCKTLNQAIKEHGKDKFKKQILAIFDTRIHAIGHEIRLHEKYDVGRDPEFWNKSKQTSTGFDVTGTKFGPRSKEMRRIMSLVKRGTQHTVRAKQNMSLAKKGKNHHMYGFHHSDETKLKLSKVQKANV